MFHHIGRAAVTAYFVLGIIIRLIDVSRSNEDRLERFEAQNDDPSWPRQDRQLGIAGILLFAVLLGLLWWS